MTLPSTQEPLLPPGRIGAGNPRVAVRDVEVLLTEKQHAVVNAGPEIRHIFWQGGMGSGKTQGGAHFLVSRSATNGPAVEGLLLSPSYPNMQQSVLPRVDAAFQAVGVDYAVNWGKKKLVWESGGERRTVWLRSAEKPQQISGSNVGFLWIDEPALCSFEAYKRARTRVRDRGAVLRQRLYTGTHEGTRTWFHRFLKRATGSPHALIVSASTFDNPFNSEDYYEDILDTYQGDPAGMQQYIFGLAADASGNIYTKFSPRNVVVCDDIADGALVVGWDFNVGWMVTVLGTWNAQRRTLHVWGEVTSRVAGGVFTEDHAIKVQNVLRERAGAVLLPVGRNGVQLVNGRDGTQVAAYIDASGYKRQTTGSAAVKSDAGAVEAAGFLIRSDRSNPQVRNRIAAVQRALKHRALLLDPAAETTLQGLQEHSRDKYGDPQKDWAKDAVQLDHYMDAMGYLTFGLMPLYAGSRDSRAAARSVSGLAGARLR